MDPISYLLSVALSNVAAHISIPTLPGMASFSLPLRNQDTLIRSTIPALHQQQLK